jgi:hypothetical protein
MSTETRVSTCIPGGAEMNMIVRPPSTANMALRVVPSAGQKLTDDRESSRIIDKAILEQLFHDIGPIETLGSASALHYHRHRFDESQNQHKRFVEEGQPSDRSCDDIPVNANTGFRTISERLILNHIHFRWEDHGAGCIEGIVRGW